MRIMHFLPYLTIGGVEIHLLILCKHLKKLGHEPVVVTLHADYDDGAKPIQCEFLKNSIPVFDLDIKSKVNFSHIVQISKLIKRLDPEIFHTHLPRSDFSGLFIHLLNRRLPWISSVHDVHSNSWSKKWLLPLFRKVWSNTDLTVAISNKVKVWLHEEMKVPSQHVQVIHYGIETENYQMTAHSAKGNTSFANRKIIGTLGRLEPRKGHDTLIKAMAYVAKKNPDALLLIAGHDPWDYGKELLSLIGRLELENHVRLVGFKSDVAGYLHSLDIFAFASYSEGFGLVNIEAMATGTPVVTSDISPMSEIVEDGRSGLLAKLNSPRSFADGINLLLEDSERAAFLGAGGKKRVEDKFSALKMAESMAATYQALAASTAERKATG